jgi:hypothetical protein
LKFVFRLKDSFWNLYSRFLNLLRFIIPLKETCERDIKAHYCSFVRSFLKWDLDGGREKCKHLPIKWNVIVKLLNFKKIISHKISRKSVQWEPLGQTDRHDEANSYFAQFYSNLKMNREEKTCKAWTEKRYRNMNSSGLLEISTLWGVLKD